MPREKRQGTAVPTIIVMKAVGAVLWQMRRPDWNDHCSDVEVGEPLMEMGCVEASEH